MPCTQAKTHTNSTVYHEAYHGCLILYSKIHECEVQTYKATLMNSWVQFPHMQQNTVTCAAMQTTHFYVHISTTYFHVRTKYSTAGSHLCGWSRMHLVDNTLQWMHIPSMTHQWRECEWRVDTTNSCWPVGLRKPAPVVLFRHDCATKVTSNRSHLAWWMPYRCTTIMLTTVNV